MPEALARVGRAGSGQPGPEYYLIASFGTLICTTRRGILAGASTNEGLEEGDLMRVRRSLAQSGNHQPTKGQQLASFNCVDLYDKSPDSNGREYE